MGLIFVIFFFRNRGCTWLPENRVKNTILDRLIVVSDETQAVLDQKKISHKDLVEVLNDGEVYFKKSDKNNDDKVYYIEKDGINYLFTLPEESFISEVFLGDNAFKAKTSSKGKGRIIHFPKDESLVYPDSNTFVTCQQEALGLIEPKKILKLLKKDAWVDFSGTNLKLRPKPEHLLFFVREKDTIGVNAIWYKNKINITSFDIPFENNCVK